MVAKRKKASKPAKLIETRHETSAGGLIWRRNPAGGVEVVLIQPTVHDLHRNGRLFPPDYLHSSWMDYLYWDSELEP